MERDLSAPMAMTAEVFVAGVQARLASVGLMPVLAVRITADHAAVQTNDADICRLEHGCAGIAPAPVMQAAGHAAAGAAVAALRHALGDMLA